MGSRECDGVGKVQRYIVTECTNDGCSMRRVDGYRINGSDRWNEEVGKPVAEKKLLLRNACIEEIWIHMTGTGHRVLW